MECVNSRIVATLASVDMVIGVHRLLRSELSSKDLNGSVRDNLVRVHVGLGTAPSLENDEREVVKELP